MDSLLQVPWGAMSVFAVVGAVTPGPVNVLAVQHGQSPRPGPPAAFVAAASLSYTLVVAAMGLGAGQLLGHPRLVQLVQAIGAAYLLWLAWRIGSSAPTEQAGAAPIAQASHPIRDGLWQGFSLQALNPKAWMVALAGVGLFVLPQPQPTQALLAFCLVSCLACTLGVGIWALGGRWLAQCLRSPSRQRHFNRLLAASLALTVLGMLRG